MDKKLTTSLGIALGASLLAGAGFGIYKYFSKKSGKTISNSSDDSSSHLSNLFGGFVGNGLTKSTSLYGGSHSDNELIGGGLYKGNSLSLTA
ncbi:hypothetical protein [Spirosoma validum]|uniref:Uncharacterized protein n=1 Tax=Spirosoma validum TaxID=2771355 RepID=A0A927GG19_9BACT|nr:hypothetical protein [Spirosoma validum]MBD2756145.1 hypothetical protein [Spirosoma validum]